MRPSRPSSELLAEDRGRLAASLRAASPEEIRELLEDPAVRVRIEQGLADADAGRTVELDDEDALRDLRAGLDDEHGPVDLAIREDVDAERWPDDETRRP